MLHPFIRQQDAAPVTARKLLMCAPTYFNIEYSINPWMDLDRRAHSAVSYQQWTRLRDTFLSLGVEVLEIAPQPGLPDMVYIDAGVLHQGRFIPSNFKYPERQGERTHFAAWFAAQGYQIVDVPREFYFEGHGDTLWAGRKLFFGYGIRSSIEAQHMIGKLLGSAADLIPVELVDQRFYHLDTCFCPLNDRQAFYYPGGLSEKARRLLADYLELIPIPEDDALKFACNAVVLGDQIVIPEGADATNAILREMGYTLYEIPMNEFIKGGGACKCLTMPVE
jgi:N-dimethylarginine dimethylaminohydrolase